MNKISDKRTYLLDVFEVPWWIIMGFTLSGISQKKKSVLTSACKEKSLEVYRQANRESEQHKTK